MDCPAAGAPGPSPPVRFATEAVFHCHLRKQEAPGEEEQPSGGAWPPPRRSRPSRPGAILGASVNAPLPAFVELFAVQPCVALEDYASSESFAARHRTLAARVVHEPPGRRDARLQAVARVANRRIRRPPAHRVRRVTRERFELALGAPPAGGVARTHPPGPSAPSRPSPRARLRGPPPPAPGSAWAINRAMSRDSTSARGTCRRFERTPPGGLGGDACHGTTWTPRSFTWAVRRGGVASLRCISAAAPHSHTERRTRPSVEWA